MKFTQIDRGKVTQENFIKSDCSMFDKRSKRRIINWMLKNSAVLLIISKTHFLLTKIPHRRRSIGRITHKCNVNCSPKRSYVCCLKFPWRFRKCRGTKTKLGPIVDRFRYFLFDTPPSSVFWKKAQKFNLQIRRAGIPWLASDLIEDTISPIFSEFCVTIS